MSLTAAEPHCCLSACSLKPIFTKLPSKALEVQPWSDAHPDSPSSPPQPGKGDGLFTGILNGGGYLSGGEIISHILNLNCPSLEKRQIGTSP